jgi:hypothetical protein
MPHWVGEEEEVEEEEVDEEEEEGDEEEYNQEQVVERRATTTTAQPHSSRLPRPQKPLCLYLKSVVLLLGPPQTRCE